MNEKEYEARLDAVKADNRALAAEIRSEFSQLETILSSKPGLGWLIGIALAIVGALIAVIQFGGSQFSNGFSASSSYALQIEQYRVDTLEQVAQTNFQVERTNAQIERNNERLESIESLLIKVAAQQGVQPTEDDQTQ